MSVKAGRNKDKVFNLAVECTFADVVIFVPLVALQSQSSELPEVVFV